MNKILENYSFIKIVLRFIIDKIKIRKIFLKIADKSAGQGDQELHEKDAFGQNRRNERGRPEKWRCREEVEGEGRRSQRENAKEEGRHQ